MGRTGSDLIPFLGEGLVYKKYGNLQHESAINRTFSLVLPQKTCHLKREPQIILRDWYHLKGRIFRFDKDYKSAKQGMKAALKKSPFLNLIDKLDNKLIYQFLSDEEVKAKKKLIKEKKKKIERRVSVDEDSDYPPPSVESSGYGSGVDSPGSANQDIHKNRLISVQHDHGCLLKTIGVPSLSNSTEEMDVSDEENANYATNVLDGGTMIGDTNIENINHADVGTVPSPNKLEAGTVIGYFNIENINYTNVGTIPSLNELGEGTVIGDFKMESINHIEVSTIPSPNELETGEVIADFNMENNNYTNISTMPSLNELEVGTGIDDFEMENTNHTEVSTLPSPNELAAGMLVADFRMENVNRIEVGIKETDECSNIVFKGVLNSNFPTHNDNKNVTLQELYDIEISSFITPISADSEYEKGLASFSDLSDLVNSLEAKELSSDVTFTPCKIKSCKVYECEDTVSLGWGRIMLVCESKVKDVCFPYGDDNNEGVSRIILDDETKQKIAGYDVDTLDFRKKDRLFVFLKSKELYL